jgi:nitrite reductase/ring-hydroxylating ferredoxin subunit
MAPAGALERQQRIAKNGQETGARGGDMGTILGKVSDAGPGGFAIYDVAGQQVAVANVGGKYYAFVDRCTHMGCPLSNGPVDGTTVTCLCHGSKFDFTTGAVLVGPARAPLDSYPVKVVDDEIELLLAEREAPPPPPAREEMRAPEKAAAPPEAGPVAAKESVLGKVPLFSILEPATIEALEAFTFRRQFEPGDIIVEEGRGREALNSATSLDMVSYLAGVHGSRTHPGRCYRPATVLKVVNV